MAAILFADDLAVIEKLQQKVQVLAEPSARITLELARLKLERTVEVVNKLREYDRMQIDASNLMRSAKDKLKAAEAALQSQRFHDSRILSHECMQLTRILQHIHWTDIAASAPTASPHTVCFQTLPDHLEMIAGVGADSTDVV